MRLKYITFLVLCAIAPILIIEISLRVFFGFPHGAFNYLLSAKDGLYPRNSTVVMDFGFRPYVVKTNAFGMRGEGVTLEKPADKIRIVAVGDSITDGYFVDNYNTYPYLLEKALNFSKAQAEVLSAARGGGSIDKEYAILKIVMKLKPDIVLLTFVSNDIAELRGKTREELLSFKLRSVPKIIPEWALTKTAIGEAVGDLKLKIKYTNYKLSDRKSNEYIANFKGEPSLSRRRDYVELFNKTAVNYEKIILEEPFLEEAETLVGNYLYVLEHVKDFCESNNAKLVFVYFPAYSQVYDLNTSLKIRNILKDSCKKTDIPFIDLTETFRKAGEARPLHLAPYDFHCNPEGNRVMAEAIKDFLSDNKMV